MATWDGRLYEWTDSAGTRWREIGTEAGSTFLPGDESFGEAGWHLIHPGAIGTPVGNCWWVFCRRRVHGSHGPTIIPPGITDVKEDGSSTSW